MKINKKTCDELQANIECAIALIDPKGTDVNISMAMSIVRIAFDMRNRHAQVSHRLLYKKACRIYQDHLISADRDES